MMARAGNDSETSPRLWSGIEAPRANFVPRVCWLGTGVRVLRSMSLSVVPAPRCRDLRSWPIEYVTKARRCDAVS
jgi:hypothetical protein